MSLFNVLTDSAWLERTATGDAAGYDVLIDDLAGNAEAKVAQLGDDPRVLRPGAPHPARPDLQLLNVSVRSLDAKKARISYRFGIPTDEEDPGGGGEGDDRITGTELDSGSVVEDTIKDWRGRIMRSKFTGVTKIGGGEVVLSTRSTGRVRVERPQLAVHITSIASRLPIDTAVAFQSTVNETAWSGFPAQTWLFRGLRSRRLDRSREHELRWTFVYNPRTWRVEIVHSSGGVIPDDASDGNGIEIFEVYEPRSWAGLPTIER